MAQLVFIVSRHRPKLQEYLQQEFAGNDEVAIIVDRRLGERRLREVEPGLERRQTDRRQALVDERLRQALNPLSGRGIRPGRRRASAGRPGTGCASSRP